MVYWFMVYWNHSSTLNCYKKIPLISEIYVHTNQRIRTHKKEQTFQLFTLKILIVFKLNMKPNKYVNGRFHIGFCGTSHIGNWWLSPVVIGCPYVLFVLLSLFSFYCCNKNKPSVFMYGQIIPPLFPFFYNLLSYFYHFQISSRL